MQTLTNSRPMQVRKTGWRLGIRRTFTQIRAILPNIKIIVLLSVLGNLVAFSIRMTKTFLQPHTLRAFRTELLDFLKHTEQAASSDTNRFLKSLRGWEDATDPMVIAQKILQKINTIKPDNYLPDLWFQLANAYFLAGRFKDYESSYINGLKELKKARNNSSLDKLGVKFLFLEDWGWVIGHISHLDQLVKLRELGLLSSHRRILVLSPEDGANKHYLKYWAQHLDVLMLSRHEARQLASIMRPLAEKLSGFALKDRFSMFYESWNLAVDNWNRKRYPPLLQVSKEDSENGWGVMDQWGIPAGSWFVALHVREYNPHTPNHNRLRAAPNADIQTYMPAIQSVIERGGWVVRMGDSSMSNLPTMHGLIDYANSAFKSEWMDVFLWASCRFFIGTSSGPLSVPPTFGVPVLYTNCPNIGISAALGRSLMLPKLFHSKSEQRLLTIDEILAGPLGWTVSVPGDDIELRDNSPEEILAGVEEMFSLLEAGSDAFDGLTELQAEFSRRRDIYGRNASTPIAHSFISVHQNLLAETHVSRGLSR